MTMSDDSSDSDKYGSIRGEEDDYSDAEDERAFEGQEREEQNTRGPVNHDASQQQMESSNNPSDSNSSAESEGSDGDEAPAVHVGEPVDTADAGDVWVEEGEPMFETDDTAVDFMQKHEESEGSPPSMSSPDSKQDGFTTARAPPAHDNRGGASMHDSKTVSVTETSSHMSRAAHREFSVVKIPPAKLEQPQHAKAEILTPVQLARLCWNDDARCLAHARSKAVLEELCASQPLPFDIQGIRILSFGTVSISPRFHSRRCIYPIGFKAVRHISSPRFNRMATCTLEIHPVAANSDPTSDDIPFHISVSPDPAGDVSVAGKELGGAWRAVLVSLGVMSEVQAAVEQASESAILREEIATNSALAAAANESSEGDREKEDPEEEWLRRQVSLMMQRRAVLREMIDANSATLRDVHGWQEPPAFIKNRRKRKLQELDATQQEGHVSRDIILGFHSPLVDALLEGLPSVPLCSNYVFLEHRLDSTELEQTYRDLLAIAAENRSRRVLGRQRGAPDPVAIPPEVWERRRRLEEERHETIHDVRPQKEDLDTRKLDRLHRKYEEKVLKEQTKEKERLAKVLRRSLDLDIARTRTAARARVATAADAEEANSWVQLNKIITVKPDLHPNAEKTREILRAAAPRLEPLALAKKVKPLEELHLSGEMMNALLQLWDYLHTFKNLLGLRRAPSLKKLSSAFLAASQHDTLASVPAGNVRDEDMLTTLACSLAKLLGPPLIVCMSIPGGAAVPTASGAGAAAVAAFQSAQRIISESPILGDQLGSRVTWKGVAWLALLAHANREMGAEERDIPTRIVARAPPAAPVAARSVGGQFTVATDSGASAASNPNANTPQGKATKADLRTLCLLHLRLNHDVRHRLKIYYPEDTCASTSSGATTYGHGGEGQMDHPEAEDVLSLSHVEECARACDAPTGRPFMFRVSLQAPGPTCLPREGWETPLLSLRDLRESKLSLGRSNPQMLYRSRFSDGLQQSAAGVPHLRGGTGFVSSILARESSSFRIFPPPSLPPAVHDERVQTPVHLPMDVVRARIGASLSILQNKIEPNYDTHSSAIEVLESALTSCDSGDANRAAEQALGALKYSQCINVCMPLHTEVSDVPKASSSLNWWDVAVEEEKTRLRHSESEEKSTSWGLKKEELAVLEEKRRLYMHKAAAAAVSDDMDINDDDNDEEEDEADNEDDVPASEAESITQTPAKLSTADVQASKTSRKEVRARQLLEIDPNSPEPLRRCQRALLALLLQEDAGQFLQPKDPITHESYYEAVLRPCCFQDAVVSLQGASAAVLLEGPGADTDMLVARAVTQFVEEVRLVFANAHCHSCSAGSDAGGSAVYESSIQATKLSNVWERLVLDWIMDPNAPPVEDLDDNLCRGCQHLTTQTKIDEESGKDVSRGTMLMCDRCDNKYHLDCLGLPRVPSGDWYCPHCIERRRLHHIDPLVGCYITPKDSRRVTGPDAIIEDVVWQKHSAISSTSSSYDTNGGSLHSTDSAGGSYYYIVRPVRKETDCKGDVSESKDNIFSRRKVHLSYAKLVELFNIPTSRLSLARPYPIQTSAPGYSSPGIVLPLVCAAPDALPLGLNPNLSAVAATFYCSNPEFRVVFGAVESLGKADTHRENALVDNIPHHASTAESMCDKETVSGGGEGWLKVLSSLSQATLLAGDGLQKAIIEADQKAVEAVKMAALEASINSGGEDLGIKFAYGLTSLPDTFSPNFAVKGLSPMTSQIDSTSMLKSSAVIGYSSEDASDEEDDGQADLGNMNSRASPSPYGQQYEAPGMDVNMSVDVTARAESMYASPGHHTVGMNGSSRGGAGHGYMPPVSRLASPSPAGALTEQPILPPFGLPNNAPDSSNPPSRIPRVRQSLQAARADRRKKREEKLLVQRLLGEFTRVLGEEVAREMVGHVVGEHLARRVDVPQCVRKIAPVRCDSDDSEGEEPVEGPVCAYCGGTELSMCSILIQAPMWADTMSSHLGLGEERNYVDYSENGGGDLLSAIRFRLLEMGLWKSGEDEDILRTPIKWRRLCLPCDPVLRQQEVGMLQLPMPSEYTGPPVHEVCAETMVTLRFNRQAATAARLRKEVLEAAALNRTGGRTLPLGLDQYGRLYWQFPQAPALLFIQPSTTCDSSEVPESTFTEWVCVEDLLDLCAVCMSLDPRHHRESDLQLSLLRAFPPLRAALLDYNGIGMLARKMEGRLTHRDEHAVDIMRVTSGNGGMSRRVQREISTKKYENSIEMSDLVADDEENLEDTEAHANDNGGESSLGTKTGFSVGDTVYVYKNFVPKKDSLVGDQMDVCDSSETEYSEIPALATIIQTPPVSDVGENAVHMYRVSYTGWGGRWDNWIDSRRLRAITAESEHEFEEARRFERDTPPIREFIPELLAGSYAYSPERARSSLREPPTFILETLTPGSLEMARAALLSIEASLPDGSISTQSSSGAVPQTLLWENDNRLWRSIVYSATTAQELMEALLILEDCLSPKWIKGGSLSCKSNGYTIVPSPSVALRTATPSSVCLRAWVLDRSIIYVKHKLDKQSQPAGGYQYNSGSDSSLGSGIGGGGGMGAMGARSSRGSLGGGVMGPPLPGSAKKRERPNSSGGSGTRKR